MKSKIAMVLIILGAIAAFVSCRKNIETNVENNAFTTVANDTQPVSEIPELPAKDFGGYEYKLLWPEAIAGSDFIHNELWVEEENGDIINDAVYKRNLAVAENYNIIISCVTQSYGEIPNNISKMVKAGDSSYDAFCTQIAQMSPMAINGDLADYAEMPHFSPDMPWWNISTMEALSIAGKQYFGTGDIIFSDDFYPYLIMCNLKLIKDYGLENPYDVVRSGNWTIGKMIEMAKGVSADLNGDGKYSWEDQYGIALVNSGAKAFFYGSGMNITGKDGDGLPYLVMDGEKTQSVLEKILQIYYSDNITLNGNKNTASGLGLNHANTVEKCFVEDRAVFLVITLISLERIRAAEVPLGLLPIPKYDEAQEDYICVLNDMTLLGVPATAPDLDRTSLILSAMSRESVSTVTPAFYELVLTQKYLRDKDSVDMLELILKTEKVPDLGTIYDYGSLYSGFIDLVVNNKTDFASFYEAKESKALAAIEKFKNSLEK